MRELYFKIRHELGRYLEGAVSLEGFREWFASATWDVEKGGEDLADQLAKDIELALAEFSSGHWSEQELKGLFRSMLEPTSIADVEEERGGYTIVCDFASGDSTTPQVQGSSVGYTLCEAKSV